MGFPEILFRFLAFVTRYGTGHTNFRLRFVRLGFQNAIRRQMMGNPTSHDMRRMDLFKSGSFDSSKAQTVRLCVVVIL